MKLYFVSPPGYGGSMEDYAAETSPHAFVAQPRRSTPPGVPLHLRAKSLPVVQCRGGYGLLTEHACRERFRIASDRGQVTSRNDAGLNPDMVYQIRASQCASCDDGARRAGAKLKPAKRARVMPEGECAGIDCEGGFVPERSVQVRCPVCIAKERDRDFGNRGRREGRTWGRDASEGGRHRLRKGAT